MKAITKIIFFDDKNEKYFGEGPYQLLKQVGETGSLHAAANDMGMAYSKATKLLKQAEKSLGFPLTVRKIGGKSGGGSVLTKEAKDFIIRYEVYKTECLRHNKQTFDCIFKEQTDRHKYGCVIMASGLGKRFGQDKLMVKLFDKPLIQYIIETTEDLFEKRVVVTKNIEVKKWCDKRNITVVYHEFPNRNDTIRLGIQSLEEYTASTGIELSGCVFCPADMPLISSNSLKKLMLYASGKEDGIFRMSYQDKVGAPVLFDHMYFESLKNLPKGKGGSSLIKKHPNNLYFIEAEKEYELWDIDTQDDYESIKNLMQNEFFSNL